MQYQTTCQKCGTSNRLEAVVCIRCGTRLRHAERRMHRQFIDSGIPQMILSSPWRFLKWFFRRMTALLTILFFLSLFGSLVLILGLFCPISWPDEPPPRPASAHDPGLYAKMTVLRSKGGTITANTAVMQQLGNLLIYDPEYGVSQVFRSRKKRQQTGNSSIGKGYFTVYKEGDNYYHFVLRCKCFDKLPLRIVIKFAADRSKDGKFELLGCRFGNIPITAASAEKAAQYLLERWAPDQELSSVARRITGANMVLQRYSTSDNFSLTADPAVPKQRGHRSR